MQQAIVITLSIILLALILRPVWLINGYFLVRPLMHPFALEHLKLISLPINWPFTVVIIIGTVFKAITTRGFRVFQFNITPLYLLMLMSLLSLAFSINIVSSISQTIKFISCAFIVLLTINTVKTKKDVINIYKGITYSSIVPMLFGYYQYFVGTGHLVLGEHTQRLTSFFGFANLYGIYLVLIIFTTAILYFEENRKKLKKLYGLILISAIVSSILALNRGSWIAISLGLFGAYPFYSRHLKLKYFLIVFAVVGVAAAGIIIKRFLELEDQRIGADTFGARVSMWVLIFNSMFDIPLLGYGSGTAREAMYEFFGEAEVPHNDYLRLLLEMGLLAPVIYLVLLFREFTSNIRRRRMASMWHINYFSLAMLFYWGIISFVQNIYHDVVVFPIFFVCCHLARKYYQFSEK